MSIPPIKSEHSLSGYNEEDGDNNGDEEDGPRARGIAFDQYGSTITFVPLDDHENNADPFIRAESIMACLT